MMKTGSVQDTHKLSQSLAEYASLARDNGDNAVARELLERTFYYEAQAAKMVAGDLNNEPLRSTLHRSAASLALQCGYYDDAERLIIAGLSGMPPEDIDSQLRDLLKEVKRQKGGKNDALLSQTRQNTP